MDNEKNEGFYKIIKAVYDSCIKIMDTESIECIDLAMSEQGVKPNEYHPDVDYHKAFDRTIEEAQRLAEAAYDVGLDKIGKELNGTWHGLRTRARMDGLIPRD